MRVLQSVFLRLFISDVLLGVVRLVRLVVCFVARVSDFKLCITSLFLARTTAQEEAMALTAAEIVAEHEAIENAEAMATTAQVRWKLEPPSLSTRYYGATNKPEVNKLTLSEGT